MSFMSALKQESNSGDLNLSVTENGALGYRTSGKALVDMTFALSSLRQKDDRAVQSMFSAVCAEDIDLAVVWLMWARDVRGGAGERRLFRVCFEYLAREFPEKAVKVVRLIAEYGRWDDVVDLFFAVDHVDVKKALFDTMSDQLNADLIALRDKKPVSLLAKWLPSISTSSDESRKRARKLALMLGVSPRQYRVSLSALRKHLDVVERKMSAQKWDKINYERVPSKANLLYREAFHRHDPDRRNAFLESLKKDPSKIKASVLFPHEIVSAYMPRGWLTSDAVDETLEALWKNLPNVFPAKAPSMLVVADGSGSMICGQPRPLDVANALAIYFAERLPGPYHDQYITFSSRPQYVDLSGATTLKGRIDIALTHDECSNTNIERTFNLILDTAVKNHLKQEDLPATILILSDMGFDSAVWGRPDKTLFDNIRRSFSNEGYLMPKLAFWNISSRTGTIPVIENELGVALVSGYSPAIIKMVMSGKLSPYDVILDALSDKRYDPVKEALR